MPTIKKPNYKKKRDNTKKKHGLQKLIQQHVYSTARWRHVRNSYFMEHPLCERCLSQNRTSATQEIHHVIPLKTCAGNIPYLHELAFSWDNLMSVCCQCHEEIHRLMKAQNKRKFTP